MREIDANKPAEPGSLNLEALADLVVMREFLDNRDRLLEKLYGRKLPRSQLRDNLIRSVVIEFGLGHVRHLMFYQKGLLHFGSRTAIRNEVARLESLGLVTMAIGEDDRRTAEVVPTRKLIEWYSTYMPALYVDVRAFLASRDSLVSLADIARFERQSSAYLGGG